MTDLFNRQAWRWTRGFNYDSFAYVLTVTTLGLASYTIWTTDIDTPQRDRPDPSVLSALLADADVIAAGVVVDRNGNLVPRSHVFLEVYREDRQRLYSRDLATSNGTFAVRKQDLPLTPQLYTIAIKSEAPFYQSGASDHVVRIQPVPAAEPAQAATSEAILDQRAIRITQVELNPKLTVLILLPAVFGLLFSILHVTQPAPSLRFTALYTFGTGLLWTLVTTRLAFSYVQTGDWLTPLFWPDLLGPGGAIIFSFIGSLTYAAYSILSKPSGFHSAAPTVARQKLLLALGGRVLIAPYVALILLAVFGSAFPAYATGPVAAFLSFFTGLYIPVVLKTLNQIGLALLSAEQQSRVVDKASRVLSEDEVARVTPSMAAAQRPAQALLDAVADARREFLVEFESVVGVTAGIKTTDGVETGDEAVVVYVVEKQLTPEKQIPGSFAGHRTDVQEVPPPATDKACDEPMLAISWPKVARIAAPTVRSAAALDIRRDAHGRVLLIADPARALFTPRLRHRELFNVVRAWQAVRSELGESHDFVAFLLDSESGFTDLNHYYAPVHNSTRGIGFRPGNSAGLFDERAEWGNPLRLRGCQVHNLERSRTPPLDFRIALHEIGHCWGMYVRIDSLVSEDGNHWSKLADNGRSCMDNDRHEWVKDGAGKFLRRPIADDAFEYSQLDRYLMGLVAPEAVLPIAILPATALANGEPSAPSRRVTVQQVRALLGPRIPAHNSSGSTTIRQGFVIVSGSMNSAEACADALQHSSWLDRHAEHFQRATGGGRLSTALS